MHTRVRGDWTSFTKLVFKTFVSTTRIIICLKSKDSGDTDYAGNTVVKYLDMYTTEGDEPEDPSEIDIPDKMYVSEDTIIPEDLEQIY